MSVPNPSPLLIADRALAVVALAAMSYTRLPHSVRYGGRRGGCRGNFGTEISLCLFIAYKSVETHAPTALRMVVSQGELEEIIRALYLAAAEQCD